MAQMSYIESGPPQAPYCPPDEANRLRDLWRPSVQANFMPLVSIDPESRDFVYRPDNYDSTRTSLNAHYPMYVIPPAIEEPLRAELAEHADSPFFKEYDDWERGVMAGAQEFLSNYIPGHAFGRMNQNTVRTWADANFDQNGPTRGLQSGRDRNPRIEIYAQTLERHLTHHTQIVKEYKDRYVPGENPFHTREVAHSLEGILGWTIPVSNKGSLRHTGALLRLKDNLVGVSWFMMPAERLIIDFDYPRLSREGGAMLDAALVELEHLVPEGTDYTELYGYQPITYSGNHPTGQWVHTDEDNDRRKREYDNSRREWLSRKPYPPAGIRNHSRW